MDGDESFANGFALTAAEATLRSAADPEVVNR
jgi:hypothetical protein